MVNKNSKKCAPSRSRIPGGINQMELHSRDGGNPEQPALPPALDPAFAGVTALVGFCV
jgi:hypothetical protein